MWIRREVFKMQLWNHYTPMEMGRNPAHWQHQMLARRSSQALPRLGDGVEKAATLEDSLAALRS